MVDTPAQAGFIFELLGSEGGKAELFGATNAFLSGLARALEAELSGNGGGPQSVENQITECTSDLMEATGGGDDVLAFAGRTIELYTLLINGETTAAAVTDLVDQARADLVASRFPEDQRD